MSKEELETQLEEAHRHLVAAWVAMKDYELEIRRLKEEAK